jgi:hypothetical protein
MAAPKEQALPAARWSSAALRKAGWRGPSARPGEEPQREEPQRGRKGARRGRKGADRRPRGPPGGGRTARGDGLVIGHLLVRRHRLQGTALQVAGDRAALGAKAVTRHRRGHLLVAAGAGVVVAAVPIAANRLVIVAGAVGRHRLVVGRLPVAHYGLIVAALHIAGRAGRRRRARCRTGRRGTRLVGRGECDRRRGGRCRDVGRAATVTAHLEHVIPGGLGRPARRREGHERAAPHGSLEGSHGCSPRVGRVA